MALENIKSFELLQIDNLSKVYDLSVITFNDLTVPIRIFYCEQKHAMKLYQVSQDLYDSIKYVDLLCHINSIFNPFSIREGDVLFWVEQNYADQLYGIPQDALADANQQAINNLFNPKKRPKSDSNRTPFLDRGKDILPPNVLQDPVPQIVVDNNKIKLTPNLFNNPKSNITATTVPAGSIDALPQTDETIERVLVRKYVRQL